MIQKAFMFLLLCGSILAEKETARTARAFRTFPRNLLLRQNMFPGYNVPNVNGPGTYAFGYEVEDPATRNLQFRDEEKLRDGTVRGSFGMLLPDGEVYITKYVADGFGYRTKMEKHNLNEVLQSLYNRPSIVDVERLQPPQSLLPPFEPILPYSIPGINNNVQNDNNGGNGVFNWVGNLGQNIQNAFRPPPVQPTGQGPLQNFFRPITSLFNRPQNENPNNGGFFGFINNIPFIGGGGNRPQQDNYNNVEQFSPIQVTSHPPVTPTIQPTRPPMDNFDYDYDIPIIRPLAVGANPQHTYSSFVRQTPPELISMPDEIMLASESQATKQDGWFKKLVKRRRLQQQLKKDAKKEIKKVVHETPEIITN